MGSFFFYLTISLNNLKAYNFKRCYNWSTIVEQLQYKVGNFRQNCVAFFRYLPLQNLRYYSSYKLRQLYQMQFSHAIPKALKRRKQYIYKHFYLLKNPFKRYKRLSGFWCFKSRRTRLKKKLYVGSHYKPYYKFKKRKRIERLFARFVRRTGLRCSFNKWHAFFRGARIAKQCKLFSRRNYVLTDRLVELGLSKSPFKANFKSLHLSPFCYSKKNAIITTCKFIQRRWIRSRWIRSKPMGVYITRKLSRASDLRNRYNLLKLKI